MQKASTRASDGAEALIDLRTKHELRCDGEKFQNPVSV